jgi:hypothetical protein
MTKTFMPRVTASERTLDDGRVVVVGEPVELTSDDQKAPHNKRLIESGQLIEVKKPKGGEK